MNDCLESQLVPPNAGDSGQLLLYFFIYGKQMKTLPTTGHASDILVTDTNQG